MLFHMMKCVWECINVIEECLVAFAENNNLDKKKGGKGREECDKACRVVGLSPCKFKTLVKTRFVSKVIFSKKFWSLQNAMDICYCRQNLQFQSRVPCEKTWAMAKCMIKTFNLVVKHCVET